MQIPYVRSGDKLHVTANTINTIVDKVNGAPTISAGKPIKGGGGGGTPTPIVIDAEQFCNMFKVTYDSTTNRINVSGGVIINGTEQIVCNDYSFSPANVGYTYFVRLSVSYNYTTSLYTASLSYNSSVVYPTDTTNFLLTLASCETIANNNIKILYYHAPSPVIIFDRWA